MANRQTQAKANCWGPSIEVMKVKVPLIAALLLLVGAVLGGIISYMGFLHPRNPMLEAQVRMTVAALPSYTPWPTYTPRPTYTPAPTCTVINDIMSLTPSPSAFFEGEMILMESFENNKNGWKVGSLRDDVSGSEVIARIFGGRLQIRGIGGSRRYEYWLPIPRVKVEDFCLTAKIDFDTLTDLNATGVSVKWRVTPYGYYFMRFYVDGTYSVFVVHNGMLDYLRSLVFSQHINQGRGRNEIKICTYQSKIWVYANEYQIDEIEDGNVIGPGSLAIGLYMPAGSETVLDVDDIVISTLVRP